MARLVTYGAACSLDGFIARVDGGLDWLHFSDDVNRLIGEYWSGIDTVLMGRRTWEVAAGSGGGGSPYGPMACFVFSRTLEADSVSGATLVSGDAAAFVRRLKQEPGTNICLMGGGSLARTMFAAGLIDDIALNVHPVLLGSGVPFFLDPGRESALELSACEVIDGGCVSLRYRVRAR